MRAVDQHSRQLEQRFGLTGPQVLVLKEIQRADELSVGELARRMNLSQATVTAIVDRLQRRALVARVRSESDKRRVMLRLSAAGSERLQGIPGLLQEQFVQRFALLEHAEQQRILATLERLADMMNADGMDASPLLASDPLVGARAPLERPETGGDPPHST